MYKEIKDLRIFEQIEKIADEVWDAVAKWDSFAKFTVGRQLVDAIDSVAANMEEADGRYHYKDKLNFLYTGRGSLKEARCWLVKAQKRRLFEDDCAQGFLDSIENILPQYNAFLADFKNRAK